MDGGREGGRKEKGHKVSRAEKVTIIIVIKFVGSNSPDRIKARVVADTSAGHVEAEHAAAG